MLKINVMLPEHACMQQVGTYQLAIDYFVDYLRMGRNPYLYGKVGLDSLIVAEAAVDSLHKKKAINVSNLYL
jgi:hypothetical protein